MLRVSTSWRTSGNQLHMWSSANPCQTYPCIWSGKRTQPTSQSPLIVICFCLSTPYLAHWRKSPANQRCMFKLFRRRPTMTHQLTVLGMKMKNRKRNSLPSLDISAPKRGLHHVKHHWEKQASASGSSVTPSSRPVT